MSWTARGLYSQRAQASVEFIAAIPALLVILAVGWQLILTGHALWLTSNAARVAARAQAVGADPEGAARSALPNYLRPRLRVSPKSERVEVRVRVPLLVRRWKTPLTVASAAHLPKQS